MNLPMRQKYVDEAQPPLVIFGEYKDGCVDVADSTRDVFRHLPREVAEKVVQANDRYMAELYRILCDPG